MNEYIVFFLDGSQLTVCGASLAYVASQFPRANIFDRGNMGNYITRYIPCGNEDGSHQVLSS